jgi:hypothetical protein
MEQQERPTMVHRHRFSGAELAAYDRGWLDGDQDAKGENLLAGFFHGAIWGAALALLICVGAWRFW